MAEGAKLAARMIAQARLAQPGKASGKNHPILGPVEGPVRPKGHLASFVGGNTGARQKGRP